jgi:succinate dehydrogenase/fumarate reductase cytochrome b subunit
LLPPQESDPAWNPVLLMPGRSVHYYFIKLARLTGWVLFFLMLVYIVTGFTLRGDFGLQEAIDLDLALGLHQKLVWPLVAAFSIHSGLEIYFALRRWGWIKPRASEPRR